MRTQNKRTKNNWCNLIAMAMRMREQQVDNVLVQSNRNRNRIQMERAIRRRPLSELISTTVGPFVLILSVRLVHPLSVVIRSKAMAAQLILWIIETSMATVRTRATLCLLPKVNIHRRRRPTVTPDTIMLITIRIRTSIHRAQTTRWPLPETTIPTRLVCRRHSTCHKTLKSQKTGKLTRRKQLQIHKALDFGKLKNRQKQ